MIKILTTQNGKTVKIDTDKDDCLYKAPVNPPNTGTDYTRGRDLYAHEAQSGRFYFYVHNWSMWEREQDHLFLISEEEAKNLILQKAGSAGWDELKKEEETRAKKYFPFLFKETG